MSRGDYMALKIKLSKDAFAELPEELQAFYVESGDSYVLDAEGVDDHPSVQGLKSKLDELIGETKAERDKRKALEAAQAESERLAAEQKGEFEALYKKAQQELDGERENARKFRQQIEQRTIEAEAMKLAGTLTRDTKRAELLKKEILQFARHTDDGVIFEQAGMSVKPDQLLGRLKEDFPFLVDGSGATGGGAAGGKGGGAVEVGKIDGTKAERIALAEARLAQANQ